MLSSSFGSKKKDGSSRLCVDYTEVNNVMIKDAYPLPRIEDILDTLSGACIYTTLDATSGYYQIPVAEEDIPKTAFQTRSGLYEFTRMPFGLSNALPVFQRTMDEVFAEEKGKFLQVYLDDIIIFSKSREEHEVHLAKVLQKIKKVGLILKKKCHFFKDELTILDYRGSKDEIRPKRKEYKLFSIFQFLLRPKIFVPSLDSFRIAKILHQIFQRRLQHYSSEEA